MAKTARIELKVEPEFKERIQKAATEKKRSVNQLIEMAIEYYIQPVQTIGGKND